MAGGKKVKAPSEQNQTSVATVRCSRFSGRGFSSCGVGRGADAAIGIESPGRGCTGWQADGSRIPAFSVPTLRDACAQSPEAGARFVSSACWDLRGGAG
jgi:hypothetical protein